MMIPIVMTKFFSRKLAIVAIATILLWADTISEYVWLGAVVVYMVVYCVQDAYWSMYCIEEKPKPKIGGQDE